MADEKPIYPHPIYKHQLTGLGKLGAALAVLCPIALGAFLPDLFGPSYDRPSAILMLALCLGAQAGLILLFVGREYVPVSFEEREHEIAEQKRLREAAAPKAVRISTKGRY